MSYITGMNITQVDTSETFDLGSVGRTSDGKLYRYCQYEAGTAAVSGVAG